MEHGLRWFISNSLRRQGHLGRTCRCFCRLTRNITTCRQTARFWLSHLPGNVYRPQSERHCHNDFSELLQLEAVRKYIDDLKDEYKEIRNRLNCIESREEDGKLLSRRHVRLAPLASVLEELQSSEKDLFELESMYNSLKARDDQELIPLVLEEQQQLNKSIAVLRGKLLQTLVQKEKHDESNVILEVTAGRTTGGGLHHASAYISGENVYRFLKYEGGTHRVQRIPEMGLSSRMQRIHTGTMTVIVLPHIDEVGTKVNTNDLRIDTFRAKGAGGQHVNTTDSAVRIVHIPTSLTVECQQHRSQLENRKLAMRILEAKLYQQVAERELEQRQSTRKLQVGTRAQSERIRTYNFTQDRVTDHRINYVVRDIKELLSGGRQLNELINKLLESAENEAVLELIETRNR
ncbi:peptide chain release factor 1, mitochondrial isoform X2 [Rhincodon typus]|uniref:peptide chain release factor 1, mitochondrial isoform X2 n=1 Tax=Rhincodon typus TaxID=259920 RepID=UPI00202E5F4D|nr:peptide chain release factor 1, mitochondrial isoform X2 [Rhincodon typus]